MLKIWGSALLLPKCGMSYIKSLKGIGIKVGVGLFVFSWRTWLRKWGE